MKEPQQQHHEVVSVEATEKVEEGESAWVVKDDQDDFPNKNNNTGTCNINADDEEERIALLESRMRGVEFMSGIPPHTATGFQKAEMFLVFQVHHRLLVFGRAGAPLAVLVLLANLLFVVAFSIHQMRNTCIPNISLIDGDLPAFVNQLSFRDSANIFICTSSYNNLLASSENIGDSTNSCYWTPCTLNGLSSSDYDLKNGICPIAYNGCNQIEACSNINKNKTALMDGNNASSNAASTPNPTTAFPTIIDTCAIQGQESEVMCQGVVSITYWACPGPFTVIGAALGYSAIIQMVLLVVAISGYILVRSLYTGSCSSFADTLAALKSPAGSMTTLEQVASQRKDNGTTTGADEGD